MSAPEPKSEQPKTAEASVAAETSQASPPAATTSSAGETSPPAESTLLPPEHWTENPPPEDNDDTDSSLGDDKASTTASITSSILKYRTIQGRTFHSEIGNAQYWGSNDAGHSDSLDILHHLFSLCLEGDLFCAPIKDPKKVLDIGTGTGIWAIDFADVYPECEVIGTDVSPIQPTWVPPNLKFEIEDCTREWTFRESDFDFVHIRYLLGCIPDWEVFFKEAFKVLKPGGYLESYEASPRVYSDDGTLSDKDAIAQWGPLFIEGGKAIGRSFTIVDDGTQKEAMEKAGFVDIQEKLIKVPSGAWPSDPKLKEIGLYAQYAVESDVEGFIVFLTNVLGWSKEQVQVYIAHLRRELRSLTHHVYYWQKVVWGRKPGNPSDS